jgi:hypothetical protein
MLLHDSNVQCIASGQSPMAHDDVLCALDRCGVDGQNLV